jgi:hypothetical protein
MQLERAQIQTWKDLIEAFLTQYKYNIGVAPTRMQLQGMTQKGGESFKEYAQKWREVAAMVQPPLLERELVDTFMSTLQGPYYERMIGSISSNFGDLVTIGERVEEGIKNGKIQGAASAQAGVKKFFGGPPKKKEGEANAVFSWTLKKASGSVALSPIFLRGSHGSWTIPTTSIPNPPTSTTVCSTSASPASTKQISTMEPSWASRPF